MTALLEERFHERENESDEVGWMENIHFLDVLLVPITIIIHVKKTKTPSHSLKF